MKLVFDANQPIYLQIMAHIRKQLVNGTRGPGDRIEPVRELALEYGVNPNTMQKALSELEREGYLYSERTLGRCVTADASAIERLKVQELDTVIGSFVKQMETLGISHEMLPEMLMEYLSKHTETIKEEGECNI